MVVSSFSPKCLTDRRHPLHLEPNVELYTCEAGVNVNYNDTTIFYNRSYSQGTFACNMMYQLMVRKIWCLDNDIDF